MSYRITTTLANRVEVRRTTVRELDEEYGYEHTEAEADEEILVLLDQGNQEIFVFGGSETDWRNLATTIVRVGGDAKPNRPLA